MVYQNMPTLTLASKNLKNLYKLALEMLQLLLTYLIDRLHKEIHPKKSHLSGNLLLYSSSHNFVSDVEAHWKNASRDEWEHNKFAEEANVGILEDSQKPLFIFKNLCILKFKCFFYTLNQETKWRLIHK